MFLPKTKHPQLDGEYARNDHRAVPQSRMADIVPYRPLYFIAVLGNGARTSVPPSEMKICSVDRFSNKSEICRTRKRPCQGAAIHCWSI
jgi:hypothetical protein